MGLWCHCRHCLWILGNGTTLAKSNSVWEALVNDAKDRKCFFYADEDKSLAKAIIHVKKELDQLDDLLNGDSILFKSERWKVLFSDIFRKSFGNLKSSNVQKAVINLLLKLSTGWRPRKRNVDCPCENSSQLVQQFKVEGLYLISTVDIVKQSMYTQVLRIWDIIPLYEKPKLIKRLDNIFGMYTEDFISLCKVKRIEGNLEVPMTWETSISLVRYKNTNNAAAGREEETTCKSNARIYVENSKVSDSLLLMKFYSLSSGVVSHLLSSSDGRELDLPFEVTDHEREIICFPRSTFVLGRSGTGKTTVLTMKLIQKEQHCFFSSEGLLDVKDTCVDFPNRYKISENPGDTKGTVLKQLFVTVSPKLCAAIKNHISNLTRFACGRIFQGEQNSVNMHEVDDTTQFTGVPDSFIDISPMCYPLVVTFHKFLMMVDKSMEGSYFDRFQDVRELCLGTSGSSSKISLQVLIRTKEVNFDRFYSSYWPHFNIQLTKKFDSSTVFTEIISYIKGGLKAGKVSEGKLNREDYVSLSEGRVSSLSRDKREEIYDIFLEYEKKKIENGHYDLADFVNDLHYRLSNGKFDGELFDFVYIDEVQDLTMKQIALFKYICTNVEEGFIFSGDTAQTIARGVDFRFQDIKTLFYNEFLLGHLNDDRGKMKNEQRVSEIFHLRENFRTHAGVLNLSQSVLELLYHYFPFSVDILSPETSLIYGEAPVLLESGNDENAIVTIFGNNGVDGGNMIGFGAEQVILVRDDFARKEISDYVGKQALVLTILECKGLEFQDVLLYNFFGTSPLRNQWRVVYEYMGKNEMLDSNAPRSFPNFNVSKHSILCSELKQLYVAITRTKQRLWICENMEEFSKPMFDYWKKLGLVLSRQLDDSLAQAMQVASTMEEWSSRGIKLFNEGNFEMATMCFERAGDSYREKWSRAASLRASADRMRDSNSDHALVALRQAAEIYEAIGKAELAAKCFIELKEFERAGTIYLEKCDESRLEEAGDCFSLAGCWPHAAEVYARGKHFSKCLSTCTKGGLFDMGLNFIKSWKENVSHATNVGITSQQNLKNMEQDFLERCAIYYDDVKDSNTMMKFVREFHSMDSIRKFLKSRNYLNELLDFEEECGNYVEAASIAREKGDLLFEADMLAKGGHYGDASKLILSYVLGNSLWASRSKGWPLKHFPEKENLLQKAKEYATKESESFCETVYLEAVVLSDQNMGLLDLGNVLNDSEKLANQRAIIISAWKILDAHLQLPSSRYNWEFGMVLNPTEHAKISVTSKSASVESLMYYWNFWRGHVANVLDYLQNLGTEHEITYRIHGEFCLAYLGVLKHDCDRFFVYSGITDAYWMKDINEKSSQRGEDLVCLDAHTFTFAAKKYWLSQVISIGLEVLETLDALHKHSVKNSFSIFSQGTILLHVFEIVSYIMKFKDWKYQSRELSKISVFRQSLAENFFGILFTIDWRKSMSANLVSLRGTKLCKDLIEELIVNNIESKGKLSHGKIGRIVMLLFAFGNLTDELHNKVARCFPRNQPWREFIMQFKDELISNWGQVSLIQEFKVSLEYTYSANWRRELDYISPHCFLYLIERLLFLVSCCHQNFFTTKSSLIEMLEYVDRRENSSTTTVTDTGTHAALQEYYDFIAGIVQEILFNRQDTFEWMFKSELNDKEFYPLLVLRSVTLICLVCLNTGQYFDVLSTLLRRNDIKNLLPSIFWGALRKRGRSNFLNVLVEAFITIENPLFVVITRNSSQRLICPESLVIDLNLIQCKEDIVEILFSTNPKASQIQEEVSELETESLRTSGSSNTDIEASTKHLSSPDLDGNEVQSVGNEKKSETPDLSKAYSNFWGTIHASSSGNASNIKMEVDSCIAILDAAMANLSGGLALENEETNMLAKVQSILAELKQPLVLNGSAQELDCNIERAKEAFEILRVNKPRLEPLLDSIFYGNCRSNSANKSSTNSCR